ncbi:P-loop containing nucleoside triphosphate hydrolase protein [Amanita rubescens]|nr:P-loop containing nucleoside triphosphate hydrolase protein [Amanita rubescens]
MFGVSKRPSKRDDSLDKSGTSVTPATGLTTALDAVSGLAPLSFIHPVSHVVTNALERSEAVTENRKKCEELQSRTRKLIQLVSRASIAEHAESPAPEVKQTLANAEKSLLAIEKQLNNWSRLKDSSKELLRPFEYQRFLSKCQTDLEDIRFNLTLETNLAVRTELMKMGAAISKITPAQSGEEMTGKLYVNLRDRESIDDPMLPGNLGSEMVCDVQQQADQAQLQNATIVDCNNKIRNFFVWFVTAFLTFVTTQLLSTSYGINGRTRIAFPFRGLPAAPEYFFGRDKILNDMIGTLTKDDRRSKHMALYGAIGSGKSTIARMLVNRVEVAQVFGRSRHWVRCQSAPTVEALLHALATSLSLKTRTNCPLTDIIEHLEIHPSPFLIVFDDFQMPENEDEIEKLTDALGKLGQCRSANVCILLTTRDLPLPEGVAWLHFLVEPLSVHAAMVMFRAISGHEEDNDEEVKELVHALGCLPFSISIAARQRQLQFKPAELLRQLESGQDNRLGRIDDVLRISLTSRRFVDSPDALIFLSILARLPKGVQYDKLPRIAPLIQNVFDLLKTILESGLANREADGFIFIQAPTRSYLLRYHPLDARHARALRAYYFQICEDGGHELGTETFKKASKALALEEENARAVAERLRTCDRSEMRWQHTTLRRVLLRGIAMAIQYCHE